MIAAKIPLKLRITRMFGWEQFLALQKPSVVVLVLVPALAGIRPIAESLGFQLSGAASTAAFNYRRSVSLICLPAGELLLSQDLTRDQEHEETSRRRWLAPAFDHDPRDLIKQKVEDRAVKRTLEDLLRRVGPEASLPPNPTQGQLFAALNTVDADDKKLNEAMVRARGLFNHAGKGWQFIVALLAIAGTALIALNWLWALYIVLKPPTGVPREMG